MIQKLRQRVQRLKDRRRVDHPDSLLILPVLDRVAAETGASVRPVMAYDAYMLLQLPGGDLRREVGIYKTCWGFEIMVAAGEYRGYSGFQPSRGARPADFDGKYFAAVDVVDEAGARRFRQSLMEAVVFLESLTPGNVNGRLPREDVPSSPVWQRKRHLIDKAIRPAAGDFAASFGGEIEQAGMDWLKVKWTRGEVFFDLTLGFRDRPFVSFSSWIYVWHRFGFLGRFEGPEALDESLTLDDLRLDDWGDTVRLGQLLEEAKRRMDTWTAHRIAAGEVKARLDGTPAPDPWTREHS